MERQNAAERDYNFFFRAQPGIMLVDNHVVDDDMRLIFYFTLFLFGLIQTRAQPNNSSITLTPVFIIMFIRIIYQNLRK